MASTPTIPFSVCRVAGFTAGSMPTNGVPGRLSRSAASAAAEAVLHATTITRAPLEIRNREIASEKAWISSSLRLP